MAANVIGLGEEAETKSLIEVQKLKIRTICQTKNKTAFLPNPCYTLARLISRMFNWNTKPFSFLF